MSDQESFRRTVMIGVLVGSYGYYPSGIEALETDRLETLLLEEVRRRESTWMEDDRLTIGG